MDRDRICMFQLIQPSERIGHPAHPVIFNGQRLIHGINLTDHTHIPVKDSRSLIYAYPVLTGYLPFEAVIILYLHHLIALTKDHIAALVFLLGIRRRIQILLEHGIQRLYSQVSLPHGCKYLQLVRLYLEFPRQFIAYELNYVLKYHIGPVCPKQEEIPVLYIQIGMNAFVYLMRVYDDVALFRLSEYLFKIDNGKTVRKYHILKDRTRTYARKLVYIPDQYESDSYRDRF